MGIINEKEMYGIPAGVCYGFPCNVDADGEVKIVEGLDINSFSRGKMTATHKELLEERKMALGF